MYKLDLPLDAKEYAAIESRKNREKERQDRIFNAKTRTIGVDLGALDTQVQQRKIREDTEKARDNAFMNDMVRNDKIGSMLEKRQEEDVRKLNRALNEFRMNFQKPETRKEFDLYDPDGKKKDKPPRVSDDDPRCGISSLQKFDGEDLNSKARKKLQEEQIREWSIAQKHERDEAEKQQKYTDHLYDLKRVELDQRAVELDIAETKCRNEIEKCRKDFNLAQVNERTEKQNLTKRQEQDDNFTEISNQVFGDMLTENPAVASSSFGPHRVVPDRWKGMTPTQLEEIRRIQDQQRQEKRRLREEEWQRDMEWDRQRVAMARAATILERQENSSQRRLRQEQDLANLRLAAEQAAHKKFLDKEVYTNPPTAQYFQQFNTTSR